MRNSHQKYDYVSHPQNLPLELNGNSKRKIEPLRKEHFNPSQCTLNEESKSLLMRKLANNVHDFTYNKSIVPEADQRYRSRPSSIKTYKENKENMQGSGIEYLIQKTGNKRPTTHKEKAHIPSTTILQSKISEKKHFAINNHYQSTNKNDSMMQIKHRQTANIKLSQDIYSNAYRKECQALATKKIESSNYFKTSQELGLQQVKKRHISDNKMIEMMGSEHVVPKNQNQPNRRQDWRISNIF